MKLAEAVPVADKLTLKFTFLYTFNVFNLSWRTSKVSYFILMLLEHYLKNSLQKHVLFAFSLRPTRRIYTYILHRCVIYFV